MSEPRLAWPTLLLFVVMLSLAACAEQATRGPERGETDEDTSNFRPSPNVDTGSDARFTDAASDTAAEEDGTSADTAEDVVEDAPETDAGDDTSADADADAADCVGLDCACTPEDAEEKCGGRPCVDGFCCDSACDGDCETCALTGSEGVCSAQVAGTDPDTDCLTDAAATCGRTGMCDGARACAFYGDDTECDDGEACSTSDACDGAGQCRGDVPDTCGPGPGNECCVGNCSDGAGCNTSPTACPDVCSANELSIGTACNGCGEPGAVGLCGGGSVYRCDAANQNLCQERSCGGDRLWCTNIDGVWQWRVVSQCDDGDACSYNDACGGGSCSGAPITCNDSPCATQECNGSSTCTVTPAALGAECEDGSLCTYNDTCNAAGVCQSGPTLTCSDAPCIDRECTGGPTCRELILAGSACDDGVLCTTDDSCSPEGVCEGGPFASCDGLDTTCMTYACDGTPSCGGTPRNIGGVCDDLDPATDLDVCTAAGVCEGDAGCPPPAEACSAGSQNRRGCGNARVISRLDAGVGYAVLDNTCSARDEFDASGGCWDAGYDHTYRLYMREGERVTIRYQTDEPCSWDTSSWQGTLHIFESAGCDDRECRSKVYCEDNERDQTANYTATQDGWIIIVADGSTAFDDEGDYRLDVNLSCRDGDCTCR